MLMAEGLTWRVSTEQSRVSSSRLWSISRVDIDEFEDRRLRSYQQNGAWAVLLPLPVAECLEVADYRHQLIALFPGRIPKPVFHGHRLGLAPALFAISKQDFI